MKSIVLIVLFSLLSLEAYSASEAVIEIEGDIQLVEKDINLFTYLSTNPACFRKDPDLPFPGPVGKQAPIRIEENKLFIRRFYEPCLWIFLDGEVEIADARGTHGQIFIKHDLKAQDVQTIKCKEQTIPDVVTYVNCNNREPIKFNLSSRSEKKIIFEMVD